MQFVQLPPSAGRVVGRYAVYGEIAVGGMATVHLGRLLGAVGFSRTVAIKRLHPQFAADESFVSMFLDEAHLASRIRHPNVVGSLDVAKEGGELLLVMDYVHGETLARLLCGANQRDLPPSLDVVCSILIGALYGLHAAHQATSEHGEPLRIVHRDVTPQNIMVGADGVARVLDFGVARAAVRSQTTSQGQVKGKLTYMSPEQLRGNVVDQRADIFAAGVVLWECLTLRRLFQADEVGSVVNNVLFGAIDPPSRYHPDLPSQLDGVVLRALARDPAKRYQTARAFAGALERVVDPASPRKVGDWVSSVAGEALARRADLLAEIETSSTQLIVPTPDANGHPTVPSPRRHTDTPVQVAGLTVSTSPHSTTTSGGSRRWPWLVVAALALAATALVVVTRLRVLEAPTGALPGPSPAVASVSGLRSPAPEPAVSRSPASAIVSVSPDALASGVRAASPPPSEASTAAARPPATTGMARRSPPIAPKSARCNPPYRVDEQGIRRIRPECL